MTIPENIGVKVLISLLVGLSTALVLAVRFFHYQDYNSFDQFFLVGVPAFALTCIAYLLLSHFREFINSIKLPAGRLRTGLAILIAFLLFLFIQKQPVLLLIVNIVLVAALFLGAVYFSKPFIQEWKKGEKLTRILYAWILASTITFFVTGVGSNFYTTFLEVVLLTFFFQIVFSLIAYYLIGKIRLDIQNQSEFWIAVLLLLLVLAFVVAIFQMGRQFPRLFDADFFLLEGSQVIVFTVVSIFSLPWLAWVLKILETRGLINSLKETKLFNFWDENLPGFLLAGLFFIIYFMLASILNRPIFDVDDIFFDADGLNWRTRLTTENWIDFYWRSIHPLSLLLLRPPIAFISAFLKGDRLSSAMIIVAFTSSLCVFLAWLFLRKTTGNPVFALLVASILGASASHLIFGSLIETYIFLAVSLMLFYVLLLEGKPFPFLVLAGVPAIGITLTNFAQNVITLFIIKPNIKLIVRYVFIVVVLLIGLSLLNNLLYPGANPFFFVPSGFLAEKQNIFPFNLQRIQAIVRSFLFYNVVAPEPILYTKDIPFTQFRFFKPEIQRLSGYDTLLQTFTASFWLALLVLAVISFVINFRQNKYTRYSIALSACILLNVSFHLRYGKELFLYSPNWTYALILLLGLAWVGVSRYKWFQVLLLLFLICLIANNLSLLYTLMSISASHFD